VLRQEELFGRSLSAQQPVISLEQRLDTFESDEKGQARAQVIVTLKMTSKKQESVLRIKVPAFEYITSKPFRERYGIPPSGNPSPPHYQLGRAERILADGHGGRTAQPFNFYERCGKSKRATALRIGQSGRSSPEVVTSLRGTPHYLMKPQVPLP